MGAFNIVPPVPADQPTFTGPPANFNIVPQAPAQQYQFAAPPDVPEEPVPQAKGHYNILQRLMGVKHAEEYADKQKHVEYLMNTIHAALTDPIGSTRIPDALVTKMGNELGTLINHPDASAAIKADIQAKLASRKAKQSLAQVNATQNRQPNLGTPAGIPAGGMTGQLAGPAAPAPAPTPAPAPAPAPPAAPPPFPRSAVDNLPWSPGNVAARSAPQGLPAPPIPFGDGGGAGAPPPPANVPAPVAVAATAGGMGFGTTPQRPPTSGFDVTRLTPSDVAVRNAQADIAGQRVLAQYAPEQVALGIYRLKAMGIDPTKLSPTQISEYFAKGIVPAMESTKAQEGEVIRFANGQILSGYPKPIQTPAGGTTTIPGVTGGVQPGELYDPNNPMRNTPFTGIPGAGGPGTTIKGGPQLSRPQQEANAWWERKTGQPIDPADYATARSAYTEAIMSPSAKLLRNAQITNAQEMGAMRRLEEQKLKQTIREFEATKGPEAIESLVDQVYQNPDLMQGITGDTGNLVKQRFSAKYGLPAPRQAPADLKNKEEASLISLNHVVALNELLKNPVIQKRMGAWDGNIGKLEQAIGTTVGLSPKDARAIQDFRTRTTYLFGQEGKAVFGGRPPQRLMDDLKKSSPRMTMGLPLFQGAMDAVQGMGELNIKAADDYRYNVRPGGVHGAGGGGTAAPPAATPPPAAPKARTGAMNNPPEKVYIWRNSQGQTVSGGISKKDEAEFLSHHPEAKAQ